jgi:hypothetical protein
VELEDAARTKESCNLKAIRAAQSSLAKQQKIRSKALGHLDY